MDVLNPQHHLKAIVFAAGSVLLIGVVTWFVLGADDAERSVAWPAVVYCDAENDDSATCTQDDARGARYRFVEEYVVSTSIPFPIVYLTSKPGPFIACLPSDDSDQFECFPVKSSRLVTGPVAIYDGE